MTSIPNLTVDKVKELAKKFVISDTLFFENTPCWTWKKTINADGYGVVGVNNKLYKAHRVMYTQIKGKIPTNLHIDHLCRVRHCVNPAHLEPVTQVENSRRGLNTGRYNPTAIKQRAKTHCPKNHEYTSQNIYWQPDSKCLSGYSRKCKECNRIRGNKVIDVLTNRYNIRSMNNMEVRIVS